MLFDSLPSPEEMLNQEEAENGFELVDRPRELSLNDVAGPTPLPTWIPTSNLSVNMAVGPSPLVFPAGQLFPTSSTPLLPGPQFFSNSATALTPIAQQVGHRNEIY